MEKEIMKKIIEDMKTKDYRLYFMDNRFMYFHKDGDKIKIEI